MNRRLPRLCLGTTNLLQHHKLCPQNYYHRMQPMNLKYQDPSLELLYIQMICLVLRTKSSEHLNLAKKCMKTKDELHLCKYIRPQVLLM